jgi:hypothetical protein
MTAGNSQAARHLPAPGMAVMTPGLHPRALHWRPGTGLTLPTAVAAAALTAPRAALKRPPAAQQARGRSGGLR